MAIGGTRDKDRPYQKQGLSLLQLPRTNVTNSLYNSHLPLAPVDVQQDQFLDARGLARHAQPQTGIHPRTNSISPAFDGLSFNNARDDIPTSSQLQQSQSTVALVIHGLQDPSKAEFEWRPSNAIAPEQRARLARHIRMILCDGPGLEHSGCTSPIKPRKASIDDSSCTSWTPDQIQQQTSSPSQQFAPQQGTKRKAECQRTRHNSPDDVDGPDLNAAMDIIQMQHIKLGDEETIRQYYDTTLKLVQQLSVKQLLKEWIKEIEPKKQKNFPYKRGIRPKWWPDDAAYKEPDHIKVEDRILVAFGIIRHAQDPNELNGQGLDKLEKVLSKQELLNDTDSAAKNVYRHNLLENFFELARAEQQVRNGERDATDVIALPVPKKFEDPNKKRRKTAAEKKGPPKNDDDASDYAQVSEDVKLQHELLDLDTLRSNEQRRPTITAPNTPTWSRNTIHDGGVCFTHASDPLPAQQLVQYPHQYGSSIPTTSRYPSFDGSFIDGPNSSPMSQYPSSATSASSMHMVYPSSTEPVNLSYQASMHGLPMQNHENEMMSEMILSSQDRPHVAQVFTAITESDDRGWSATPAAFIPPQHQGFGNNTIFYR